MSSALKALQMLVPPDDPAGRNSPTSQALLGSRYEPVDGAATDALMARLAELTEAERAAARVAIEQLLPSLITTVVGLVRGPR